MRWIAEVAGFSGLMWILVEGLCRVLGRGGVSDDVMFAVQMGAIALLPVGVVALFGAVSWRARIIGRLVPMRRAWRV